VKQICSVCRHEERLRIEAAVLDGRTLHTVADEYGLHKTQLWRHMNKHLPRAIELAQTEMNAKRDADLLCGMTALEQVQDLQKRTMHILSDAESAGDRVGALRAIRELRSLTEFVGRLTGEDRHRERNGETVFIVKTDFTNDEVIDAESVLEVETAPSEYPALSRGRVIDGID